MIAMVLGVMGLLFVYQYRREKRYREEQIQKQLDFINQRIINAYQRGVNMRPFINFLNEYFEDSDYDDISVSVFTDGKLSFNVGLPILRDFMESPRPEPLRMASTKVAGLQKKTVGNNTVLLLASQSADGRIVVHTAMPYSVSLMESFSVSKDVWIMFGVIGAAAIILCLFTTRFLTRNITLLRDFADRAAGDEGVFDTEQFPHDELGDISRQIVKIYHSKASAVERSEKEHKIALHAVEEKSRIKRELTNNINHELKTPIGVIKGYLDTIISNPDMDDSTRNRFLLRSQENVERLCNLLSDVSAMTRLEDGANNVPVTEIAFHDLVFTIENDLRVSGLSGGMTFNYNVPLDCMVMGNASLLVGMVSNLIKNAAQHSHGTEMGLNLIVESDKYYTFSFYDNGNGVEQQHLPHLFERFYRIDAGRSRKVGGTGLGLPIVKNTVEALGGTISAHNRSEGGLEFLFTLKKWVDE